MTAVFPTSSVDEQPDEAACLNPAATGTMTDAGALHWIAPAWDQRAVRLFTWSISVYLMTGQKARSGGGKLTVC